MSKALDFITSCSEEACNGEKKTHYRDSRPFTYVLDRCIVIQSGMIKQIMLKKGKTPNYNDEFNPKNRTVLVRYARDAASRSLLPLQKSACVAAKEAEEKVELNIAIWTRDQGYGEWPRIEKLFSSTIKEVHDYGFVVQVTETRSKRKHIEDDEAADAKKQKQGMLVAL